MEEADRVLELDKMARRHEEMKKKPEMLRNMWISKEQGRGKKKEKE